MEKELKFKMAGILSVIAMIIVIIPGNMSNSRILQILFVAALPYIMLKLRDYISYKYEYKDTRLLFNILILFLILHLIVFFVIRVRFNFNQMDFKYALVITYLYAILSILRGILFFGVGLQLRKNYDQFNLELKIISICFIIFGLGSAFLSSWVFSDKMIVSMPIGYTMMLLNLLNILLRIVEIIIYGILAYIFLMNKEVIKNSK